MSAPVSAWKLLFEEKNDKPKFVKNFSTKYSKPQLETTEKTKINDFFARWRRESVSTFRNISARNMKSLEGVLFVFRKQDLKTESKVTTTQKWHQAEFGPNKKSLPVFVKELNKCTERSLDEDTHGMIDHLFYAKLPLHLELLMNLAYLQNSTFDQIVAQLEKETDFSGLENDCEIPIRTAEIHMTTHRRPINPKMFLFTAEGTSHFFGY